ncbi:MAG: hypothetical protein GWP91_11645 [Rhodobacterales bacterium]|nr:hypothetical protein [Rhodobacterales bacterium]
MKWLYRIWHELTRPRGHVRHRFYRVGRSSRAGVALLMVMAAITLLTVITTEVAYASTVRIKIAAHARDEVKAEALAETGIHLYKLILMASAQIGKNPMILQYGEMLGINADTLWQMVPFINTQMMRMIFVSDGDLDEDDAARMTEGGLSDEESEESREGKHNFLDFDGDFSASVEDESRFVYVGALKAETFGDLLELPAAQTLQGLMGHEKHKAYLLNKNIEKMELIGALVDWQDADSQKLYQGGDEASEYQRLDDPYMPKNAPFDTIKEIRLVEGWHIDGVWERFGKHLTIYGAGKVNVNTATQPVLHGLLVAYLDGYFTEDQIQLILEQIMAARGTPVSMGGIHFSSGAQFQSWVQNTTGAPLRDEIVQAITTDSKTFRIHSTGVVGKSRVEIHAVIDFSRVATGQIVYWKVI